MTGPTPAAVTGRTAAAELAAVHGALIDDLGVFGTCGVATEPVPAWAASPLEVQQRLRRKDPEPLTPALWQMVAALIVECEGTLRPFVHPHSAPDALHLARQLRRALPAPPRALLAGRPGIPTLARRTRLEQAVVSLCVELDDPRWTDPDALAGWINDAHDALSPAAQPRWVTDVATCWCLPQQEESSVGYGHRHVWSLSE